MKNKGISSIVLILIVFCICAIAIGITYLFASNRNNNIKNTSNNITENTSDTVEKNSNNKNDTEVTLEQIAEKFKNCKTIKSIIEAGTNVSVKVTNDMLTISSNGTNYDYKLENGILSIEIPKTDFSGGVYLLALVDSVAQLHGYEDGATFSALNSEVGKNLKISDGFEMVEENNIVKSKIDINKKIQL